MSSLVTDLEIALSKDEHGELRKEIIAQLDKTSAELKTEQASAKPEDYKDAENLIKAIELATKVLDKVVVEPKEN